MPDDQSARGREAARPQNIPPAGWKDVLRRSWQEVSHNNIFLISGGVTYAILLALFPGLAALVPIYGLVLDPNQIEKQVGSVSGVLPEQSRQLISDQLHQLASASGGALGFGAIVGMFVSLWSASRGMSGMMTAIDIAYEEDETRSFFKFNIVAIGLTICAMIGGFIAIALVAGVPAVVQFIGLGATAKWLLLLVEWPLLVVLVMAGLAPVYR